MADEIFQQGFEFDLDSYTMAEKWQFNTTPEVNSTPFLIKVVKKWPYEGLDPQKAEDYGKLTQGQYDKLVDQFFASIFRRRVQSQTRI